MGGVGAYEVEDLMEFLNTGKCVRCDLKNGDITGFHFNSNLETLYLDGSDLKGANFEEMDLRAIGIPIYLMSANFSRANLTGVNLSKAFMQSTNFRYADLSGANLAETQMDSMNFTGANLRRTGMQHVIFCETIMPDGTINNSGC